MPFIELAVTILLYFAIIVHFLNKKGFEEKMKFASIVAVALVIIYGFNLDFIIMQTILIGFLAMTGVKMLLSKWTVIILLLVFLFLPTREFFPLFLLATVFYAAVVLGFIFSAGELMAKGNDK